MSPLETRFREALTESIAPQSTGFLTTQGPQVLAAAADAGPGL